MAKIRKTLDPLGVTCPECNQPPELPCWKLGKWGARINCRPHSKRFALAAITPQGYIEIDIEELEQFSTKEDTFAEDSIY